MANTTTDPIVNLAEPGVQVAKQVIDGQIITAPELIEKPKGYSHASIRYTEVVPKTPANANFNIGSAALVATNWDLVTSECFYPYYTEECFDMTLPTVAGAATYLWVHQYCMSMLKRILLNHSSSTQIIMDLDEIAKYLKVVLGPETNFQDFKSHQEEQDHFRPSLSTAQADQPGCRYDNTAASRPFDEPIYIAVKDTRAATTTYSVKFRLGPLLKHTFFSSKNPFWLPKVITMRQEFHPSSKWLYGGTSPTNPVTGAAALGADNVIISNLRIRLAIETDLRIVEKVRRDMGSGNFEMLLPTVNVFNTTLGAIRPGIQIPLNDSLGGSLMRIYHAVFDATESGITAFDHTNLNGSKVVSYQTGIGIKFDSDAPYSCTTAGGDTDYELHRDMLKGSVLQDKSMYKYNWFHCSRYDGLPSPLEEHKLLYPKEKIISGLPITERDMYWRFTPTMAAATQFIHYTWVITQRALTVTGSAGSSNLFVKIGN